MTVPATARRAGPLLGNGVTTSFPFSFRIFQESDIRVVKTLAGVDTNLVLNSDYTVAVNVDQANNPGGAIIPTVVAATGVSFVIIGNLAYDQSIDLPDGGAYRAEQVEGGLDKLAIQVQQIKEQADRSLAYTAATGAGFGTLPDAAARSNKFLSFDADGVVVMSTGTGADAGLREDLASKTDAASGSGLGGHGGNLNYAAGTIGAVLNDAVLNVKMSPWLAKGDGVTDDTAAIQAAFDFVASTSGKYHVYIPAGVYRTTATLNILKGMRIEGAGTSPYDTVTAVRGDGSWIFIDHLGKGFNIHNTLVISGVKLENFGTFRNQPAAAPGWIPLAADYDIYIDNADVTLTDMMLLNPTKGVRVTNGNYGRLEINNLRGQAMQELLRVAICFDCVTINGLRQWPFWDTSTYIQDYTRQNLDVLYFERSDTPFLTNIFSIFARSTMRFGQNASGKTSKMHVSGMDCDSAKFGIWVDNTVTSGITAQFDNVTHQGAVGVADSRLVYVDGNTNSLSFGNIRTDYCNQEGVRINGTGNDVRFYGVLNIYSYNQAATGKAGIEVATGNSVYISGIPVIANGGAGVKYSGVGRVFVNEWRTYTPTVTSTTGTLTTVGAVAGFFKLYENTVDVTYDVTITTNGTGATSIRVSLPFLTLAGRPAVGVGRAVNITGKTTSNYATPASTVLELKYYDNTYPGADGVNLVGNVSYAV